MIDEKALEAAARAIGAAVLEQPEVSNCITLDCDDFAARGIMERDRSVYVDGVVALDDLAQAAITAYLGALEGWVLVPVEPTARDMMFADMDASSAMIAARPQNEGE